MEIIGSSLAKATRIFPVMDCFQTHNRWGCSAKKWVSRENGGRESGVQKRLKGENNLGEKTAGICLIDSMHTISRGGLFLLCFSFLVSFFLSFLFFFWFCFHAKLDYFYGAIYSTKFTTKRPRSRRFGHSFEGKRPGKCQTWPQYNEDLWTCLGAIRASIASPLRWRVALPLLYNSWKSKEKYYSTQSFWISPKAFLEKLTWFWLLWRAIRRAGRKR